MINPKDILITKELVVSALLEVEGGCTNKYCELKPKVQQAFDIVIYELRSGLINKNIPPKMKPSLLRRIEEGDTRSNIKIIKKDLDKSPKRPPLGIKEPLCRVLTLWSTGVCPNCGSSTKKISLFSKERKCININCELVF